MVLLMVCRPLSLNLLLIPDKISPILICSHEGGMLLCGSASTGRTQHSLIYAGSVHSLTHRIIRCILSRHSLRPWLYLLSFIQTRRGKLWDDAAAAAAAKQHAQ
jgi:hypothetical protein